MSAGARAHTALGRWLFFFGSVTVSVTAVIPRLLIKMGGVEPGQGVVLAARIPEIPVIPSRQRRAHRQREDASHLHAGRMEQRPVKAAH